MKKLLLAGAGIALVLTALAVIGALLQWWWLVAAAAMILLSAAFLTALDADRRVRDLRPFVRQVASGIGSDATHAEQVPPQLAEADIVGAVRVLQAQYTGRLDRMQASLEQAAALLHAEGEGSRSSVPPGEQA